MAGFALVNALRCVAAGVPTAANSSFTSADNVVITIATPGRSMDGQEDEGEADEKIEPIGWDFGPHVLVRADNVARAIVISAVVLLLCCWVCWCCRIWEPLEKRVNAWLRKKNYTPV